jgi:hypothetical protein
MLPSPDEPYPRFSREAQDRYEATMAAFGREVAEQARAEARNGGADLVSEAHMEAVGRRVRRISRALKGGPSARVPPAVVAAVIGLAGTALLVGLAASRTANVVAGALLMTVAAVLVWRT